MTTKEVADYLKVCRETIIQWILSGQLNADRKNQMNSQYWEIDKTDLDNYLLKFNQKG